MPTGLIVLLLCSIILFPQFCEAQEEELQPPQVLGTLGSFVNFGASPTEVLVASAPNQNSKTNALTNHTFGTFDSDSTSIAFPATSWTSNRSLSNNNSTYNIIYTAALVGTTNILLSYTYDPSNTINTMLSGNNTVSLTPGSLKYTLTITGPDARADLFHSSTTSTLRWQVCILSTIRFGSVKPTSSVDAIATTYTYSGNQGAYLRLRVPNICFADNISTSVTHLANYTILPGNNGLQVCVTWTFPNFATSLVYDPDLSVKSASQDDHSPTTNNARYAAIIIPSVTGGTLCICLCFYCSLLIGWTIARLKGDDGEDSVNGNMSDGGELQEV